MADSPITQKRRNQYRGPLRSDDYNLRLEENYQDLAYLYNRLRLVADDVAVSNGRHVLDQASIMHVLQELSARVDALESDTNHLTMWSFDQVDNDRFDSTVFQLAEPDRLSYDTMHGAITLPEVVTSSVSKLAFTDDNNAVTLPSTLEMRVEGEPTSADSAGAVIDSSAPESAVLRSAGVLWQRNVAVGTPDPNGAELTLYVKAPTDIFTTANANAIVVHPFPAMGCDVLEVAVTTNVDVLLDSGDSYTPVNSGGFHSGDLQAVGWTAPGGWVGDEDLDAGPRIYLFDPLAVTGLKIRLRQRNYYREGSAYVYSYGLSHLDLRYNKYSDTGRVMVRFDAPAGTTISSVTNVIPEMFNISEAEYTDAFSYRVIWETAYESGVYTETPVPLSNRVWIEVTLNRTSGGGSPALSGLTVEYA